jgi:hypothetical protein
MSSRSNWLKKFGCTIRFVEIAELETQEHPGAVGNVTATISDGRNANSAPSRIDSDSKEISKHLV